MLIFYYIVVVLAAILAFYLTIPAISLFSVASVLFVGIFIVLLILPLWTVKRSGTVRMIASVATIAAALFGVIILGIAVFSSVLFQARAYAGVLGTAPVQTDISKYAPTIDTVPLMDRSTAELLMNRTMGTLVNEISQFELGGSTQINYQGRATRVSPLEYGGFLKWLNNKETGIPSYITVDMQTQETEIHTVAGGIRYSPSAYFGEDLMRHLRFHDLTALFGSPVFELDEKGNPIWVVAKLTREVGLFGGTDVEGIYTVDAVTGDISYYPVGEVPSYIDNVYSAALIIQQYDCFGQYQDGFLNSVFGQKNVRVTTDGYNYIPLEDDIYLYTGVTSVGGDESNIGFLFANLRTKEIQYFEQAGAEEYSAMASAEGSVQHLGYTSTFPLLLKIERQPTYCVALKDAGGLVKMYGLVNVEQYQIVVTGSTIGECLTKYRAALRENNKAIGGLDGQKTVSGVITDIRSANIDGSTHLYIQLEGGSIYYELVVSDNREAVLLNVGDRVSLAVLDESGARIHEAVLE